MEIKIKLKEPFKKRMRIIKNEKNKINIEKQYFSVEYLNSKINFFGKINIIKIIDTETCIIYNFDIEINSIKYKGYLSEFDTYLSILRIIRNQKNNIDEIKLSSQIKNNWLVKEIKKIMESG